MADQVIRVRAYAKVNLALAILGKRTDGFHEIRTVFQSIDLHDRLEFRPSREFRLRCVGMDPIPFEENLVGRAALRLAEWSGVSRGAEIVLDKRIPIGAGLGGGSSDAAATLRALSRLWELRIGQEDLAGLAGGLGSDVAFFLTGGTALGEGRGERISSFPDLPQLPMLIVVPGIHIQTAEAYQTLSLRLTSEPNTHRIQRFCALAARGIDCLSEIFNDFETSILRAYPPVREAKEFLGRQGATASLLSGSGSSVFGFFLDEESALEALRSLDRKGWRAFPAKTLSRALFLQGTFG